MRVAAGLRRRRILVHILNSSLQVLLGLLVTAARVTGLAARLLSLAAWFSTLDALFFQRIGVLLGAFVFLPGLILLTLDLRCEANSLPL